jgi:valyl-tRNA synthetase
MPLCEIVIPLEGVIDFEAEVIRLKKELAGVEVDIAFFVKKLSNERFVANAPAEVVETDRAKLRDAEGAKEKLLEGLRRLEGAV